MSEWDLIEYTENLLDYERIKEGIKSMELETEHPKYKTGDVIKFTTGMFLNIRATSVITGFDKEGGIYVLWDCYWVPISDDIKEARDIVKVDNYKKLDHGKSKGKVAKVSIEEQIPSVKRDKSLRVENSIQMQTALDILEENGIDYRDFESDL